MAKRSIQSRVSKPSRSNRIESGESSIPNARAGGVRVAPGESRLQDPVEEEWNDLASSGERPSAGDGDPIEEETPEAAKSDEDKQDKIRALLGRQVSGGVVPEGETESEEGEAAADDEAGAGGAEGAPETAAAAAAPVAPGRKSLMASVDAEQKRLALERQLGEERTARKSAEDVLKGGLGGVMRRLGLTKDQAMDLILADPNEGTPAAPAATAPDKTDERLTRLETRERDINKREALGVVEELTKDLSIPVVRATSRVTVTDSKGRQEVMSGRELVLQTAQRLWENAGSPSGDRRQYIAQAAPLVEAQLIEDQKEAFEAYAASKGATRAAPAAAAAPKPKKPAPSLGRTTPGPGARPAGEVKLPEDEDERRTAIKARFGLR